MSSSTESFGHAIMFAIRFKVSRKKNCCCPCEPQSTLRQSAVFKDNISWSEECDIRPDLLKAVEMTGIQSKKKRRLLSRLVYFQHATD